MKQVLIGWLLATGLCAASARSAGGGIVWDARTHRMVVDLVASENKLTGPRGFPWRP
jgi:hypothetical protein